MEEITPEAPGNDETEVVDTDTPETDPEPAEGEPQVFDRDYVEKLRSQSFRYRERAKAAESRVTELEQRLHSELVKGFDTLTDPRDLPFDAEHLDDTDKLAAAIEAIVTDRPHLKKRTAKGDIGLGNRGDAVKEVSLLEILKGNR